MKKLFLLAVCFGMGTAAFGSAADVADAAEHRNADLVRVLAKQRADVNAAQPDGSTALHWAAHWGDLEMVNALLQAGAKPGAANRYGATPLSEAASLATGEVVQALLKAGADPKTLTSPDSET